MAISLLVHLESTTYRICPLQFSRAWFTKKVSRTCVFSKPKVPVLLKRLFLLITVSVMLTAGAPASGVAQTSPTPEDPLPAEEGAARTADAARPASPDTAEASGDEEISAAADSSDVFPKKMKSTSGWEKVVSLPGMIIYLPFWAVFELTTGVMAIQEEYKIGRRLAALLVAPDGSRGIMPVYSSRSGFGVEFFQKQIPGDRARFNLTGSWGLRGRSLYQARLRRVDLFGGVVSTGGQLTFRNMPDENFFGIGPNSLEEDKTNYQIKMATAELALGKWITPKFVVGGIIGLDHSITGAGKSDKSPSTTDVFPGLPGLDAELTVTRLTLGLYYDGKNRPVRPSGGFELEARARIDQEVDENNFAYTTAFVDFIKFAELFRDRTLFLRFAFRLSDPLTNKQIPFYQLSELGADETIRGFQRGRFRDFDAILGTVEYRYPIWRSIDALLFADAGQVQQDIFRDFASGDTQFTFGGGFRFWKSDGTLMRLELGKSEDGFRFLFQLNPTGERREFAYY